MRRYAVGVGLALLLILAGCTFPGSTGQSDPADPVTPAPAPEVDSRFPDISEIPLTGITENTSITPATLARTHSVALENRSVWIREYQNWTSTGVEVRDRQVERNGTLVLLASGAYRHNETRITRYFGNGNQSNVTVGTFANESVRLKRTSRGPTPVFTRLGPNERPRTVLWNTSTLVRQYLSVETVAVDRITWRGEPHYRITGQGAAGSVYSLTSDYRVRAIVEEDGLVRRLTVTYIESPMGRERNVVYRLAIDPIDSDRLRPPGWLERAQNRTGAP